MFLPINVDMDLYKLSSLFLEISLGVMLLGAVVRLIMMFVYYKRNGSKILTDEQKKILRKAGVPVSLISLVFVIISIALLLFC